MKKVWAVLGMALGLFVVLVVTLAVFGLPVGDSLAKLFQGAFGDAYGWSRTLVKTTPLLLTGIGMVIAWRAGMYNIGGEGQFLVGGLFGAAVFAFAPAMPGPATNLAILIACTVGGMLWAGMAGWLHVHRGVQVVICTILLNFVAIRLVGWAVSGPLQESARQLPLTQRLPENVMLARWNPQSDLHVGVVTAFFVALLAGWFLFRTVAGYRLRLVGESPTAARANRIDAGRYQILAMLISGGLCGLAGGIEYTALAGQIGQGFSQNWGFLAIPVALLGGLHPVGTIFSATYFGALFAGSENLARFTTGGSTIILVMQAVAVLGFVGLKAWADRRVVVEEAS
ncbi:MAG: ABC transporter permease [Fimbriimonadaceae bacterium]